MSSSIKLSNVGPIRSLEIPAEPGVVVLRGWNGSGKSTALDAASKLIEGDGKLEARYGTAGGVVEGFGAKLTISAARTKGTGEIVVTRLEGADIGAFVDPGIIDPERADAARIAELCRLVGAQPSLETFAKAIGVDVTDLKSIATAKTLGAATLPEMAAGLRRDLQAQARDWENRERESSAAGRALLAATGGEEAPRGDLTHAQTELEEALKNEARITAEARERGVAHQQASEAREKLAEAATDGPTVQAARASLETVAAELQTARARVAQLETAHRDWTAALANAESHERALKSWEATIAAAESLPPISDEEVQAAKDRLQRARTAHAQATLARDHLEKRERARKHLNNADLERGVATNMRELADKVEAVITQEIQRIAPAGLQVHDGRLVLDADGKSELFGKLSHGERWRIALDIALDALPKSDLTKIIVVSQESWEGLDPDNRRAIDEHAKARGAVVLTAEADAGDLRAEQFEGI